MFVLLIFGQKLQTKPRPSDKNIDIAAENENKRKTISVFFLKDATIWGKGLCGLLGHPLLQSKL